MMKKLLWACSFLVAAAAAQAGMQTVNPVTIGTGEFHGALGDARALPGSQYIQCMTGSGTAASSRYASCSAYNGSTSAYCYTYGAGFIAAVDSMKSDAFVQVLFNTSTSQCTSIYVTNGSDLTPK